MHGAQTLMFAFPCDIRKLKVGKENLKLSWINIQTWKRLLKMRRTKPKGLLSADFSPKLPLEILIVGTRQRYCNSVLCHKLEL